MCVKGSYCIVFDLPEDASVHVGARGLHKFPRGVYVYVGSALAGVEKRVERHLRSKKKRRWHIDYLVGKGEVVSTIMVPSASKSTECAIALDLLRSPGAQVVMKSFGSSDCKCPTHLVYFGPEETGWVCETVARAVALSSCVYPATTGSERE